LFNAAFSAIHASSALNKEYRLSERIKELEQRITAGEFADSFEKVDVLNDLAWELRNHDPTRALDLSTQSYQLSEACLYVKGMAVSLRNQGFCNLQLSNHQLALSKSQEALRLFEEMHDPPGQASALNGLGNAHHALGDYVNALEAHRQSLRIREEISDLQGQSASLDNIGIVYQRLIESDKALEQHFMSLKIKQEIDDKQGQSASLNNIGFIYEEIGDKEKALDFYNQSLKLGIEMGDKHVQAVSLMKIGNVYSQQGDTQLAMNYHLESLKIRQEIGDKEGQSTSYINIGELHAKASDLNHALVNYYKGLEIAREIGDRFLQATVLYDIGVLYTKQGNLSGAMTHLDHALKIGKEISAQEVAYKSHKALSEACEASGDLPGALRHLKAFREINEKVFSEESEKRMRTLLIQFELQKADGEKEIYRLKNIELVKAFEELELKNQQLKESDKQKSQLLTQLRRQAETLERQAQEDSLTGLFNRRYADYQLSQEFRRALRFGRTMAIALADIDHFKAINDKFAHHIGDEVIRTVGEIMNNTCRAIDTVARYEGEEFLLIFPETSAVNAVIVCEKIRKSVEVYKWDQIIRGLKVTISIGLSDDLSASNPDKMLAKADEKLYEAKQKGRNRILW
jgi:diguanylate cyclase (GGDEF)-like protein